jgi:DNA-binding transcriptional MerR regulator
MPSLDIAAVARRSGVPASALRHYESKGLIRPIGRLGLRRVYDADVLERLALVALGRAAGFSLDEIGTMLGAAGKPKIDRAALARRADEVERAITRLVALRDGLRHAAACRAPSHLECPSFRRLMRAASATAAERPRGSARRQPPRR